MVHPRVCPFLDSAPSTSRPLQRWLPRLRRQPRLQPDADNRCDLAGRAAPLRIDVQGRYCLGGRHARCPIWPRRAPATRPPWTSILPILAVLLAFMVVAQGLHVADQPSEAWSFPTRAPAAPTEASLPTVAPSGAPIEATTEISFIDLGARARPIPLLKGEAAPPGDTPNLSQPSLPPLPPARPIAAHPPERIVAPDIGLDAPVIAVSARVVDVGRVATIVWDVPEAAAGWHDDSALPGQPGNIVLSGHHNMGGEVFRHLVALEPGNEIILYADGRPYRYVVQSKMILPEKGQPAEVRQENARWIGPFPEERLTLVTCWPYTSNTHRLIVVALPADVATRTDDERPSPPAGQSSLAEMDAPE